MKNVWDVGFSRKRGGNARSGPPFQILYDHAPESMLENNSLKLMWVFRAEAWNNSFVISPH